MKLVIVTIAFLIITGCSTMHILKDCAKTDLDNIYVCKNLKPWE